ncbi:hypothetical protein VitviT2T_021539 [Vitis vinifera]|uniref:Uncharacterized protein n=1 Tax=Vitis vinifera TaxID=29760 RepID=A0ABY9D9M9_VITVI|nr:hypothetical protein VitviT2T_021539 [Vitis vinifera]
MREERLQKSWVFGGIAELEIERSLEEQNRGGGRFFFPGRDLRSRRDLSAPLSGVFETLQALGFLASLAPRALPDPVPPQFRLDLYCAYHQSVGHHTDRCTALRHAIQDIVDSGTFGHPQSDMSLISTPAQAMHADAPSPAVPDLIDLGD